MTTTEIYNGFHILFNVIKIYLKYKPYRRETQVWYNECMNTLTKDFTKGDIARPLIRFSLPLIFGNLLQQLYNVADTLIVGRTIGKTALVAVGSSFTLMILLTSIILGLCMGTSVVFSNFYGAGNYKLLRHSVFNSFAFIMSVSLVVNFASFLLVEVFIKLLQIPPEAADDTRGYLNVILFGMIFVAIYNFVVAILRSIGNTVVPLIFLAISTILNIILDLLFILKFGMGVKGAAWATVTAQMTSCVGISIYYFVASKRFIPRGDELHFDKDILRLVFENSVLTSIQQSVMNFGILMVQGLVNSFGVYVAAAFAAVTKIDGFFYMPSQEFGNAFSIFAAQNYGAKDMSRVGESLKKALMISAVFCMTASVFVWVFARNLMMFFVEGEQEIIRIGVSYLRIEGAFYIGIGFLFILYGLYRGILKPQMSIVLTVLSLGLRVALAYIMSSFMGVEGIWYSIPIGWAVADAVGLGYFVKIRNRI